MKRTFLYALSACFGLAFLGGIVLILTGNQLGGMLDALVCMILTGLTLRAAERAPEARSKPGRVVGWLIGLTIGAVCAALIVLV